MTMNSFEQTIWYNPLDVAQKFTVQDGSPRGSMVVIPPKGEVTLPAYLDRAVQLVQNGVVMGGLAPQLVNKSAPQQPALHESLDTELQKRKDAEARMALAQATLDAAERGAMIAAARVAESAALKKK